MHSGVATSSSRWVASQNWGNPTQTPRYENPYYGDPQNVPLVWGNLYISIPNSNVLFQGLDSQHFFRFAPTRHGEKHLAGFLLGVP